MRALLIVNPHSGDEGALDELLGAAREREIETHVLGTGDDLERIARDSGADVLGMAGGDGSLACVAAVCSEREIPFVCIPFGTRNHFARDLGLDRDDPVAALDAFAGGNERRVDMGRVNERPFLNNVSLGSYAELVDRRERHRRRKVALARTRALTALIKHHAPLRLEVDGEPVEARIALISNNAYSLEARSFGERERLDAGSLHLYVTSGLLRREWRDRAAAHFTVDAPESELQAAIDGEPEALKTPIELRIDPGALRVLVSREARG